MNIRIHALKKTALSASFVLAASLIVPVQVFGLSADQKAVFDKGIYYFDTQTGVASGGGCIIGGGNLPSAVPQPYNGIFTAAAAKFNIPSAFLAALFYAGEHGSSWPTPPPPYGSGSPWATSPTGAQGPFQFEPYTWPNYAQDGNGDGVKDVQDLTDAAFAAADYLAGLGARNTTDVSKLHDAARRYNGSGPQAEAYADNVMNAYQQFTTGTLNPKDSSTAQTSTVCSGGVTSLGPVSVNQNGTFGEGDGLMGHQPTMIGLHYTAGNEQTVQDVINDLKDPTGVKGCNKVTRTCSVQFTVLPDGSVYQLTSRLDVITENIINFNDADIGIEIAGRDEQTLLANQTQFNAVTKLVAQLMQQYNIKVEQDFNDKAGLMGHMECDNWSQAHLGNKFSGMYSNDPPVQPTDSHQDPGATYMSNVRSAVGGAASG